jgi:hypothetical protein
MKNHKYLLAALVLTVSALLLNACSFSFEVLSTPTSTPVAVNVSTSTPQALESTLVQTSVNDTPELSSSDSDRLGFCFSYPQGYTQIPNIDTVEIAVPDFPGTDTKGLFWIEISDSYERTAEKIADEDMTYAAGVDVGRWTVTLGGEQAVVLDGMPGQDLQRRVYVVHQQTLYVLAFMPTRSENKVAGDQMETLYTAVTNSWTWSPCSAKE